MKYVQMITVVFSLWTVGSCKRPFERERFRRAKCTNIPFGVPLPWGNLKLNNLPSNRELAQKVEQLSAPLKICSK